MASKYSPQRPQYIGAGPCRQCNRPQTVCGKLSARRLCADCGEANMNQAARELQAKNGPAHERWQVSMVELAHKIVRQS